METEALPLWAGYDPSVNGKADLRDAAAAENKQLPIHRWAPWIAGYSAQLVSDVIASYLPARGRSRALVLDPFAGVATTLVEALQASCQVVGYEINGYAALAARAKINCVDVPIERFQTAIGAFEQTMSAAEEQIDGQEVADGPLVYGQLALELGVQPPAQFTSRIPFFSPSVELKVLVALRAMEELPEPDRSLFLTALGSTMVSYSNYSYEPSLSTRPSAGRPLVLNAPVCAVLVRKLQDMLDDLRWAQERFGTRWRGQSRQVFHGSYFESELEDRSVSLLVTSPPYLNNYHYVRNTRPQLFWLNLVANPKELIALERQSFGKFWQTVRQGPPVELQCDFPQLSRTVEQLRQARPERGAYGGAGWANYVATYFNDTDRFLTLAARHLRPGAHAVVVVGNSIVQGIEFKVDHLLAQLAERHGLQVEDIHIVRTKRVGSSIIDSPGRTGEGRHRERTQLYDAAVILKA
jgi:hypothetical protein